MCHYDCSIIIVVLVCSKEEIMTINSIDFLDFIYCIYFVPTCSWQEFYHSLLSLHDVTFLHLSYVCS